MPDVGFIGLGLLGSAITERLLAAGYDVVGFDVDPTCRQRFEAHGGRCGDSAADVVAQAPLVILSLPDSGIVAQVLGEIESVAAGKRFVDTTTGDPQSAIAAGQRLAGCGARYVEATVIGSSRMLRERDVVVLIGGEPEDAAAAAPFVDVWSKQRFHVGPLGSAAKAKLVANLVLGLNRAVLAEGLTLAIRSGLDGAAMLEVLRSGLAYSRVMDTKGRKMLESDFDPEARLRQRQKDVRLILELGAEHGARLPLSELHDRLLSRAESLGFADADNSAIIRAIQEPE